MLSARYFDEESLPPSSLEAWEGEQSTDIPTSDEGDEDDEEDDGGDQEAQGDDGRDPEEAERDQAADSQATQEADELDCLNARAKTLLEDAMQGAAEAEKVLAASKWSERVQIPAPPRRNWGLKRTRHEATEERSSYTQESSLGFGPVPGGFGSPVRAPRDMLEQLVDSPIVEAPAQRPRTAPAPALNEDEEPVPHTQDLSGFDLPADDYFDNMSLPGSRYPALGRPKRNA
jgi:hypothetical protein